MSNSTTLQCCQFNLISPFSLPVNSFCCNGIVAPTLTNPPNSGGATTCSLVDCSGYAPVCFVPTSNNLCGYLSGIDAKLCALDNSILSMPCSSITMTGTYACIFPPVVAQTGMNLCVWAARVNTLFCNIFGALQGTGTGTLSTTVTNVNTTNNNLVTDGGNGTMTVTTGITSTNGTIGTTSANTHGTSSTNVTVASSNPLFSATLSTTSNIAVTGNNIYEIKAFVYVGAGSPGASVLGITVNGTGTQRQIQTVNTGSQSGWQQMVTQFTPNTNQNVTITIGGSGFTSGSLAFADMTMQPVPAINSGGYYEFQLPYINDIGRTYNNIASNFAASLTYSASGLFVIVGADVLVLNGKTIFTTQQSIGLSGNATSYVFYDSWTDTYIAKTTNVADATQMLLYTIVTNGSVVTSKTINCPTAPFAGNNIQNESITGGKIAAATIADSNLTATGVTASTYGDATHVPQFAVNAQGRITSASPVAITFPVTSVNSLTGAVSLGLGNLTNVVLTSPSNGQFLKYNGTNWVNASITANYYQTVYAALSAKTQRAGLNFNGYFALTDDSINGVTTVSITAASLTYDRIQNLVGGNVLLGNSTGASGGIVEQTVSIDLLLTGGQLSVNYVVNKQNVATYNAVVADFTGTTIIACQYPSTNAMSVVLPAANTVAVGRPLRIKDISGSANTHNITVTVTGGANIDGSSSVVINTAYGKTMVFSDGTNYYSL